MDQPGQPTQCLARAAALAVPRHSGLTEVLARRFGWRELILSDDVTRVRRPEQNIPLRVGGRRLSITPVVDRDLHRNVSAILLLGLDRALDLRLEGADGSCRVCSTTVLLAPNTAHAIRSTHGRMAWIHLDAARDDEGRLRALMRRDLGASAVDHVHDAYIRSAIAGFALNRLGADELDRALSIALGLSAARPTDGRIAQAIAYLRDVPGEDNLLTDIAPRVGMEPSAFRRRFSFATGVTYRRFRMWTRMEAAIDLMRSGASLTEAAHAAGFASSAHFSHTHRTLFGITPSVGLANARSQPADDSSTPRLATR